MAIPKTKVRKAISLDKIKLVQYKKFCDHLHLTLSELAAESMSTYIRAYINQNQDDEMYAIINTKKL